MKYPILIAFSLALMAVPYESEAQIFKLRVKDNDYGTMDPTFISLIDTELAEVEADINKKLPSSPPERLMEGVANSSVIAGKGIGKDYASNMEVALVGAGLGVGADLKKDKTTDSSISGLGVAPGLIFGFNMGFMDAEKFMGMYTDRLNLYFNFLNQSVSRELTKKTHADLDMLTYGVHLRYDLVQGSGSRWLGWGGIKTHFGYEFNRTDMTFTSDIRKSVTITEPTYTIEGNIRSKPQAIINSEVHSVSFDVSTDVQILYFLSLYTGLGADYSQGYARGRGKVNGDEGSISCTGGIGCTGAGNPNLDVVANADIDAKAEVTPWMYRGFVGVQFNLPFMRIFVQGDKSLGNDLAGATVGLRLVY